MDEDYQLIYNNSKYVKEFLETNLIPIKIEENKYYKTKYKGEEILISFNQPSNEELVNLFNRKETIIYL